MMYFTRDSRMLRASWLWPVCLSVTLLYCTKTVLARIMKSLLWTAPRTLVFYDEIWCRWVKGFLSNEGVKEGYPNLKRRYFAAISFSTM